MHLFTVPVELEMAPKVKAAALDVTAYAVPRMEPYRAPSVSLHRFLNPRYGEHTLAAP